MSPTHAAPHALLLSVHPRGCASHLHLLRGRGMTVRVATDPDHALVLLRSRPDLVLVDLVNGPGLSPRLVMELNRAPRAARVVALHAGRLDSHIDQVEHLAVDGFWRIEGPARTHAPAD